MRIINRAWFGKGDAGEIFFYLPWTFKGYVVEWAEEGYRQPLIVIGKRPGRLYMIWGSNGSGTLSGPKNQKLFSTCPTSP